jgi:hypothetical protein
MATFSVQIHKLLDELTLSLLTNKKEALTEFEEVYVRSKPKLSEQQITLLLLGDDKRKGLCKEAGCMSWKNGRLKNSAVLALSVLSHLLDPKKNSESSAFISVFTRQPVEVFLDLALPAHLRSSRGDRSAACFLIALIKRDNFAASRSLVDDDLPDDIRNVIASTLPAQPNGTFSLPVAQLARLRTF